MRNNIQSDPVDNQSVFFLIKAGPGHCTWHDFVVVPETTRQCRHQHDERNMNGKFFSSLSRTHNVYLSRSHLVVF